MAVTILLYRKTTRLWWTFDDFYLIHLATAGRAWRFFADPQFSRSLPGGMFVPLLPLTYGSELAALGLTASAWHAVALTLTAIFSIAWYSALRLWLSVRFALIGALLTAASVPLCSIAAELMLMHYLESLIFTALAVIFYVRAIRSGVISLTWISAFFYLAAMLAKEIAIPLIAILLVMPESELSRRMRAGVAHALALLAYLIWRFTMLGTFVGGYGWALQARNLETLPWRLFRVSTGPTTWLGAALAGAMIVGVVSAIRTSRALAGAIIGVAVAVVPIIPVSEELQPRYGVAWWLTLLVLFVAGCQRLDSRKIGTILGVIALVFGLVCNRQAWALEFRDDARMSLEGQAFFNLAADSVLRQPLIPPNAMNELRWLKEDYLRGHRGTGWFYDDLFLCNGGVAGKRVWQYDRAARSVVEVTSKIQSIARTYCTNLRMSARLSGTFRFYRGTLWWRLGPYQKGSWKFVLGDGLQTFEVPAIAGYRLGDVPGLSFRIRYQSPESWVTYSPDITLDFIHRPDFTWHR